MIFFSKKTDSKKNDKSNDDTTTKKKKKRRKRKRKDDWSDDKPWTPERVLRAIHAQSSPVNWGIFLPSKKFVKPLVWGHGDLTAIRKELLGKDDQVLYGLMRLTFGDGRFKRAHWILFVW